MAMQQEIELDHPDMHNLIICNAKKFTFLIYSIKDLQTNLPSFSNYLHMGQISTVNYTVLCFFSKTISQLPQGVMHGWPTRQSVVSYSSV